MRRRSGSLPVPPSASGTHRARYAIFGGVLLVVVMYGLFVLGSPFSCVSPQTVDFTTDGEEGYPVEWDASGGAINDTETMRRMNRDIAPSVGEIGRIMTFNDSYEPGAYTNVDDFGVEIKKMIVDNPVSNGQVSIDTARVDQVVIGTPVIVNPVIVTPIITPDPVIVTPTITPDPVIVTPVITDPIIFDPEIRENTKLSGYVYRITEEGGWTPLARVRVELYRSNDADELGTLVSGTLTSTDGRYDLIGSDSYEFSNIIVVPSDDYEPVEAESIYGTVLRNDWIQYGSIMQLVSIPLESKYEDEYERELSGNNFMLKTVRTPLKADFIARPTSGPAPLTVAFSDLSTGNPSGWSWDFGDGKNSNEVNPSHIYYEGTYTVHLQIWDAYSEDEIWKTDFVHVNRSYVLVMVPDLVGRNFFTEEDDIAELLDASGLYVGTISKENSVLEYGTILHQDPDPGTEVERGGSVALLISAGSSDIVAVPDVCGYDITSEEGMVIRILDESGLCEGRIVLEYSDEAEGTIVRQEPAPYQNAERGSPVDLFVATRLRDLVEVPDVCGYNFYSEESLVVEILDKYGLCEGSLSEQYSTSSEGMIVSQYPEAGSMVARGSPVSLVVSKRETDLVSVPDLTGRNLYSEERVIVGILGEFGLNEGRIYEESSNLEAGTILHQSPKEGSQVLAGSDVDLWVASDEGMPDMVLLVVIVGSVAVIGGGYAACRLLRPKISFRQKINPGTQGIESCDSDPCTDEITLRAVEDSGVTVIESDESIICEEEAKK